MLHAACPVQNNVKDVEDIKTSHNRFLTDFLEFISLLSEMSKCKVICVSTHTTRYTLAHLIINKDRPI